MKGLCGYAPRRMRPRGCIERCRIMEKRKIVRRRIAVALLAGADMLMLW